ncbi:MAG: sigma-E factor negative regulatory protein RseC [Candidatus Endobugula sp.]|jgi:sigma-E factor negative regulatory protein RseC
MLEEEGRVVSIETDALWVETIQQSTCGRCAAKKGCGQSLLAKIGAKSSQLRVLIDKQDETLYQLEDSVMIGIPENVVVNGSLFVYLLPLLLMVIFSGMAHTFLQSETASLLLGSIGFAVGGLLIYWQSQYSKYDSRLQPVLLYDQQFISIPST